jgi:hypothetical protein
VRGATDIHDKVPGFSCALSEIGRLTTNMSRTTCKDRKPELTCRRLCFAYPGICEDLGTNRAPSISTFSKTRAMHGIKKILIGFGRRYDPGVKSPD